jgi:hypothetical protein
VGVLVAIWWQVSAKRTYTGPVRTIDTDERGRVIEEPAPPAPTGPGGTVGPGAAPVT